MARTRSWLAAASAALTALSVTLLWHMAAPQAWHWAPRAVLEGAGAGMLIGIPIVTALLALAIAQRRNRDGHQRGGGLMNLGTKLRTLRADTGGAIGVVGALVATIVVGATALPVANIALESDRNRMQEAATAAGIGATKKLQAAIARGEEITDSTLAEEAQVYAVLNLLDLPETARRKAIARMTEGDGIRVTRMAETVRVELRAKLPGTSAAQALAGALPGGGSADPSETLVRESVGESAVACTSDKVKVVLAMDMTNSMSKQLGTEERRAVALDAAGKMVEHINRLCGSIDIEIGIVPWASAVRVPAGDESRWMAKGWVDKDVFTERKSEDHGWAGCLEDRDVGRGGTHTTSNGLNLALPSSQKFKPYVYPDTQRHHKRNTWAEQMQAMVRRARAQGRQNLPDESLTALAQSLRGDNDWARGGGPNKGCTKAAMRPLRKLEADDTWLAGALDEMGEVELTDEGTLAHLGITWGRRMLEGRWAPVWDASAQGEEKEEATEILVLLSDGENSFRSTDAWDQVPGRYKTTLWECPDGHKMAPSDPCGGAMVETKKLESAVVTGYSALGRNGAGAEDDGHRNDTRNITSSEGGQHPKVWDLVRRSRDFIDGLLLASCSEARKEGIEVYTVSLSDGGSGAQHQDRILQQCGGTAEEPGSAAFTFQATDDTKLKEAFTAIGSRVVRVRRTG